MTGESGPDRARGLNREIRCSDCPVRHHCLADHLEGEDRAWLEQSLDRRGPYGAGDLVYRTGQPLENMAAVFSGALKSTWLEPGGREHVAAFHLPGDLLGMDALHEGRHRWDVVAVDTVYICEFHYERIQDIAHQVAGIRRQFMRLLSRELVEQGHLATGSAVRRLARFLRDWAVRLALRGHSGRHFVLQMTRRELASHLNLTPETLSRAFRRLVDAGVLQVRNHEVWILDGKRLKAL